MDGTSSTSFVFQDAPTLGLVDTSLPPPVVPAHQTITPTGPAASPEHNILFPPESVRAALFVLKDYPHSKILEKLHSLRSLASSPLYHLDPLPLAESQTHDTLDNLNDALVNLKQYPNELIFAWLGVARGIALDLDRPESSLSSFNPPPSKPHALSQDTSPSMPGPPAISSNHSLSSGANKRYPTANSRSHIGRSFPETSGKASHDDAAPPVSVRCGHQHWCTMPTCDKFHKDGQFKTCDSYKRHEREHDSYIVCMPDGDLEYTAIWVKCAFCSVIGPDTAHIAAHNTQPCANRSSTFTRKCNFLKHVKIHGDVDGAHLAQKWRETDRKAYACGFCSRLFRDIAIYSSHVDTEHYGQNKTNHDWDPTKAIHAFLMYHSDINAEWRRISRSDYISGFCWDISDVRGHGNLQIRLELGIEPAGQLVQAVWAKRKSMAKLDNRSISSGRPAEEDVHTGSEYNVLPHRDGAMQLFNRLPAQGLHGGFAYSHLGDCNQLQNPTSHTLGPGHLGQNAVGQLAPQSLYDESVPVETAMQPGHYPPAYDGSYSQGNWQVEPLTRAPVGPLPYNPVVSGESNPKQSGQDAPISWASFHKTLRPEIHQSADLDDAQNCSNSIRPAHDPQTFQSHGEPLYEERGSSWTWLEKH